MCYKLYYNNIIILRSVRIVFIIHRNVNYTRAFMRRSLCNIDFSVNVQATFDMGIFEFAKFKKKK